MNDHTEAPVSTDAELRALWQQAGGTFYSANREIGSMPARKLLPFLRGQFAAGLPVPPRVAVLDTLIDIIRGWERPEPDELERLADVLFERLPQIFGGSRVVDAEFKPAAAPAPAKAPADTAYASALMNLVEAVCPGLDTGNLLEDARKATQAFAKADLAAYFGVDEDGRYVQVRVEHAGDPDIVPLFHRALKNENAAAEAPATPGRKAAKRAGGAS